ncbi:CPBP family glutamic-type intramembrane protease [Anaerosacchariphilus polymeriproducens]|uniref:CPBP family intramembrane metalloprotease n=1 Tax=Anaerosacchariphilus polymeriproducens TaxID=1812858 RepID=A0A371AZE5_9FIRM|nr:CPBP family glutamic-type intramembrane protease [Anaerosacchariphilus polymeriproducens]RDU24923.1 CPBP family intramembrane metalloprotease [Anaerosacchariphilus polymeriproducens]
MINLIKRFPIVTYMLLTFLISWSGLLIILGIDVFTGKAEILENEMPLLFLAMCAGPSVAGLLMIYVMDGRSGITALFKSLVKWKLNFKWYLFALLTAPIVTIATVSLLALYSPRFIPDILSSDEKVILIVGGIAGGMMAGFFEEIGWSGFAISKMRFRNSILTVGIFVGALWGVWHLPLFTSVDPTGKIPLIVLLVSRLLTQLPAYRILIVWLYDCTDSLFITIVMHMSLTTCTLTFQSSNISSADSIIFNVTWTIMIWAIIFLLKRFTKGQLNRSMI